MLVSQWKLKFYFTVSTHDNIAQPCLGVETEINVALNLPIDLTLLDKCITLKNASSFKDTLILKVWGFDSVNKVFVTYHMQPWTAENGVSNKLNEAMKK